MRHPEADLKPHKRADMMHEGRFEAREANLMARLKPERSDLRLERADFRQEMADNMHDRGDFGWRDRYLEICLLQYIGLLRSLLDGRKAKREKWQEGINQWKENSRKSVG